MVSGHRVGGTPRNSLACLQQKFQHDRAHS